MDIIGTQKSLKVGNVAQFCMKTGKDFYIEYASRCFKVPYSEVTEKQRREIKNIVLPGMLYARSFE